MGTPPKTGPNDGPLGVARGRSGWLAVGGKRGGGADHALADEPGLEVAVLVHLAEERAEGLGLGELVVGQPRRRAVCGEATGELPRDSIYELPMR